jgi:MerR family transcriptional regulator, light-induced transcriptional regulator
MSDGWADRYVRAQLEGDRASALRVVEDALTGGMSVPQVHLQIIQVAQYEIGRLWETNAISIAVEHQATAISQLALATLYARLPRARGNGKRVLLACVEGELHDMGSRIVADFLEMDGFDVRLLGANVPATSLAQRVDEYSPHLVALSATMAFHLPALEQAVARVRSSRHGHVPILVGGRAFGWSTVPAAKLDVQGFAKDADELLSEARRLTSVAA